MGEDPGNVAKGRNSKDIVVDETTVAFINHNSSEYPVTVSAPKFDLVNVENQKDISLNVAKQHAKEEYERIMEMVRILEAQAKALVSRLDATELIHQTHYMFVPIFNRHYHVYLNTYYNRNELLVIGPKEWNTGLPEQLKYVATVLKKGDSTWEYVDEDSTDN